MTIRPWLLFAALALPSTALGFATVERSQAPKTPVAEPALAAVVSGGGTERPERRIKPLQEEPILLAANRVRVTIQDQIAVAKVVHVLQNNTGQILQARYLMPLGERAHVSGYAIWEKGERVHGELMDVRQAERLYKRVTQQELTQQEEVSQTVRAVRVARDPGILRQMAPDRFETHVYPIMPWALKQVEFLYSEAVVREGGWCVWRFPLQAARAFKNPIGEVVFEVDLGDSMGIGAVESSWPDAKITRAGGRVRVQIQATAVRAEGPLEVRWRTGLAPLSAAVLAHREGEGEGYALVRVALPEGQATGAGLKIALAVDASRSLSGAKSRRRDLALEGILDALDPGDEVSLLRFAGEVSPAWDGLRAASLVDRAQLEGAEGEGRTELIPALEAAFASVGVSGRRLVVFASDGVSLEDPEEVLDAVEPNGTRLLVVGTGHDDNVDLLLRLAERHGGALWIPGSGERNLRWAARDPQILAQGYGQAGLAGDARDPRTLVAGWREAAVTGARLEGAPEVYPLHPLDGTALAPGGVATFAVRYSSPGDQPVRFRAFVDDRPLDVSLTLSLPASEPRHRFVAGYWARARVAELLREHPQGDSDPNRPEVVRLALEHGFATPYTAFLSLPNSERERLLLGSSPTGSNEDLYEFKTFEGGAPEAEVWILIFVGLLVVFLVRRARETQGAAAPLAGLA